MLSFVYIFSLTSLAYSGQYDDKLKRDEIIHKVEGNNASATESIYYFEGVVSDLFYDGAGIIFHEGFKIGDHVHASFRLISIKMDILF